MEIEQIFESFNSQTILVIGDVMVDAYLFGKVNRISPEAPVPVVSVTDRENRLGGAANVALNLKSLGVTPILCSIVGNDEKGRIFKQLLTDANLSNEGIVEIADRKTTTKTRIISGTQHTLRVDDEICTPIVSEVENILIEKVRSIIAKKKVDAIIFEDYDKGALTEKVIRKIVTIAKEINIPTLVDPKKRNFLFYNEVSLFKPNFKELIEGMKLEIANNAFDEIASACSQFQKQHNINNMMVTLSELGVLINTEEKYYHIPAKIRHISDVSGAGDTVISVASACMAAGMEAPDIANISNIAGGLVCEQSGVVPIDKSLLLSEIKKHQ